MKLNRDAKFGEESTCRFKIGIRNLTNLTWALESLKKFHLNGLLLSKVYIVELKKYRAVIFHETEEGYKVWRGIYLSFQNWHKEFDKFWPENSKVSKLELWWDLFVRSRKYMSLIFTGELCVMTVKNDTKIEEELSCHFKIDMRNFTSFDLSTRKSKKFVLIGSLWQKYILLELKSIEELSFMTLISCANFEEKLTCGLKKDLRNLANFHQSTWKCQNWDFDGILFSKVEKVWP